MDNTSVDHILVNTLCHIAPVWNSVKENESQDQSSEPEIYFVFNYTTYGTGYADNDPTGEVYIIQVHLFAPLTKNLTRIKKQVKASLHAAGFTWPETVDASDEKSRHIVFEFQHAEGVVPDGDLYV